jgi:Transposase DDE domain
MILWTSDLCQSEVRVRSQMKLLTCFFPSFNRAGLGRKPLPIALRLTRQICQLDALCLGHLETLLGHGLPDWLRCFRKPSGANSRKRTFTPVLTFWTFLSQVLDPGGSCRRALSRVQALCALKGLAAISDSTAAYCNARSRLCARMLIRVLRHVTEAVQAAAGEFGLHGRLLVMDGTVLTLPDSEANRSVYSYAPGQKPGCGFPQMHLLGLFDLRSGAWLRVVKSAARRHDSALAWKLIGFLRDGDTLVADRAFCSYAFIAELRARGVHVVMRLHQRREANMHRGKRLGKSDRLQTWVKPVQASKAMNVARHAALPETLQVRLIATQVAVRGHRPETMFLATTLNDPNAHSAVAIAALYLRRWEVELFFDDIKTSQNMDMLRCQSPDMLARELLMHMIAHNLVRMLMVQADKRRVPGAIGRLSFKGTLDRINQWHGTLWGCSSAKQADGRYEQLLQLIAKDAVPQRLHRSEPRVVKRRHDSYPLMNKPRSEMRLLPAPPKHKKSAA